MGAKAPEKLKLRRQSCKCHDCGRKFLNTQALSSHRKFMHKPKSVATKRDAKKPTDMQDAKVVKKKVVSPPDSKTTAQLPTPKVTNKNSSKVIIEVSSAKKPTVVKKTEFKCPKCVKVFCVYFTASRHIQKYHCVDENDKPVTVEANEVVKMGAKAPEKLKLRRQSCKCHDCGRKFLNTQALSSHRKFMHKPKSVATKRDAKKPTDMQDAKVVKKKVVSPPDSKTTAQLPTPKVTNKNSSKVIIEVSSAKKATVMKKTEFKCPKCVKVFCVYFSASRHIQKYHCVDENDKPVASDSPDIVKPIRVELCESCKKYTATSETHTCETVPNVKLDRCMCLGCQKTFEGLTLFEQHIKTTHTHRADCLFFTSNNDYATWKTELEAITKIKFVSSGTPEPKSKQIYYHCSHQSSVKSDKTLLCPSMYSVTELSNGYRVVYYKEHFGHSSTDLSPLVYKKYSILPFLKDVDIQNIDSDDHVHQQLRSIVNNVTANAAKADIGVLYSLLEKALAMTVVLNNVSAEDHNVVNKSMSDEQITEVLSDVKIYPGKRKSEAVKKDVKQPKLEVDNNENLKTNTVTNKTVTRKAVESLASTPLKQIIQSSPSSFNDSYKDFVESNFKPGLDSSTAKKNVAKKKAVVKTKIGQFKVRPSLSPKVDEEIQTSLPENDKPNLSPKRLRTTLSPKTQISKPNERPVSSPKTQISKPNERPVSSPKTVKPTPKLIEPKKRPDFEYEVREQENDCNILILKF